MHLKKVIGGGVATIVIILIAIINLDQYDCIFLLHNPPIGLSYKPIFCDLIMPEFLIQVALMLAVAVWVLIFGLNERSLYTMKKETANH